jgi:hypothetical protein
MRSAVVFLAVSIVIRMGVDLAGGILAGHVRLGAPQAHEAAVHLATGRDVNLAPCFAVGGPGGWLAIMAGGTEHHRPGTGTGARMVRVSVSRQQVADDQCGGSG